MTCRHAPGDPNCGASARYAAAEDARESERKLREMDRRLEAQTPDAAKYEIDEAEQVGAHLVIRARYPSCAKCSYEGVKVMVYLDVTTKDALRWRKIDPHFADPKTKRPPTEAPGPAARFPGSAEGWADALDYARRKARPVMRSAT